VVHQIADFANKVLTPGVSGFAGRLDDLRRLFEDFFPDRFDSSGEQLARVRLIAGIGGPIGDGPFQLVQRSRCGAHGVPCLPSECAGYNNVLGNSLILGKLSRKRRVLIQDVHNGVV
jgi:hypothetical protein